MVLDLHRFIHMSVDVPQQTKNLPCNLHHQTPMLLRALLKSESL